MATLLESHKKQAKKSSREWIQDSNCKISAKSRVYISNRSNDITVKWVAMPSQICSTYDSTLEKIISKQFEWLFDFCPKTARRLACQLKVNSMVRTYIDFVLKVSQSQNEILVPSNLPKSQPNFRQISALCWD